MRTIEAQQITEAVKNGFIEAAYRLPADVEAALRAGAVAEESPVGQAVLQQLLQNAAIAREGAYPLCQDTGMAVVFAEVGQEIYVRGSLEEAIQAGVRQAYGEGYLRKSVVADPFLRQNTGDNGPAIIHYQIVPGDGLTLRLLPKGFGSENMSRVFMLKPAAGIEGAKDAVIQAISEAGPNPCPPMVVGVGCGGDFELCALLAKKALLRPLGQKSPLPHIAAMEEELLQRANALGIGPAGLGGRISVLGLAVETYPTHIAGLPVAVNICCHAARHAVVSL